LPLIEIKNKFWGKRFKNDIPWI